MQLPTWLVTRTIGDGQQGRAKGERSQLELSFFPRKCYDADSDRDPGSGEVAETPQMRRA